MLNVGADSLVASMLTYSAVVLWVSRVRISPHRPFPILSPSLSLPLDTCQISTVLSWKMKKKKTFFFFAGVNSNSTEICYHFGSGMLSYRSGVGNVDPGGPVSLQRLAPTLIKHTWSSRSRSSGCSYVFFFQGFSGLELNSEGTPALQDQRSPPLIYINTHLIFWLIPILLACWTWGNKKHIFIDIVYSKLDDM